MTGAAAVDPTPSVWTLLGRKAGDNTQVLALAEALQWGWTEKRLRFRSWELLTNRLLRVTLAGLRRADSDPLVPPWPDLLLTAGRRNEPVARWIKRRSQGRVRIVHLGRPWAPLACFDLVVTTPQYDLPDAANVLHNDLPLHRLGPARLEEAARIWRPRLAHLPSPRVAVLVGGPSGPYHFGREKLERLATVSDRLAARDGGALLVTTSARTPPEARGIFERRATAPLHLFEFEPDSPDNPYLGYLALADVIVVTGESMSMLAESCFTGKPVYIFDPGGDRGESAGRAWWLRPDSYRGRALGYHLRSRIGPRQLRRDIGAIQRRLVESGRAAWLGDEPAAGSRASGPRDLERAVERVRALFVS